MICQCLADQLFASAGIRQIIDLLTTDKSRYFAQPHPIIVNYPHKFVTSTWAALSSGNQGSKIRAGQQIVSGQDY